MIKHKQPIPLLFRGLTRTATFTFEDITAVVYAMETSFLFELGTNVNLS